MDELRIPNDATYAPVSLMDLVAAAPLASRLLLGMTLPGRMVSAAALGLYAGSAVKDWVRRLDMKRIDFMKEFGADVRFLETQPDAERRREMAVLAQRLNDGFTPERRERAEMAREVDRHLTDYIASITGQRVVTSSEVRDFTLAKILFPFASGVCDVISGDVAIFRDTGIFEPHVLAHEFTHRKGYWKELHAQVLAYLSLTASGDPLLVQSARAERLYRQIRVLAGEDPDAYHDEVESLGLREELARAFHALRPPPTTYESTVGLAMKALYEERMRLTGQNGLSDYDEGFTNFLWTFAHRPGVRQDPTLAQV